MPSQHVCRPPSGDRAAPEALYGASDAVLTESTARRREGVRWRIAPEVAADGGYACPLRTGARGPAQAGPRVADISHVQLTSAIRPGIVRRRRFRILLGSDPFSNHVFHGNEGRKGKWCGVCYCKQSHDERSRGRARGGPEWSERSRRSDRQLHASAVGLCGEKSCVVVMDAISLSKLPVEVQEPGFVLPRTAQGAGAAAVLSSERHPRFRDRTEPSGTGPVDVRNACDGDRLRSPNNGLDAHRAWCHRRIRTSSRAHEQEHGGIRS